MDLQQAEKLLFHNDRDITSYTSSDENVERLIHKADPQWEQLCSKRPGKFGPIYTCSIALSPDITLDLVVARSSKKRSRVDQEQNYQLREYQVVVAEGTNVSISFGDRFGECKTTALRIFANVDNDYRAKQILQGPPSHKRTQAAIMKYLSE